MSDYLSSNSLVESVKRRASVPENQSTFTKADFLEFANEELRLALVPKLMSLHEDFLLFEIDIPIEPGKNEYEIPSRAVGNKLRDVQYKRADGSYSELTRIGIGDRFSDFRANVNTGYQKYYIKNNKVVFYPDIGGNSSDFVTMVFYIKPSKLVLETRCGVVTGINTSTGEVVLSSVPSNFGTDVTYDFYRSGSPFNVLKIDASIISINTTTKSITFAPSDIPEDLKVGDHICQSGECIIPQVPSELHVLLAQMIACRVLESQGDAQGLQLAMAKLADMQESTGFIIDNRVEDSPKKISPRRGIVRNSIAFKKFNK